MINEEKRLLKVFLCHASGDKPPVRQLYKELVAEGVDAWLDQEKLLPGQDWRLEIPKAVQEADVVVICLSKKSVTKEGYVQKEIQFALDIAEEKPEGTIFLIPARLENCDVPERLSRWQWVDLYEEYGLAKLLRSLKIRADKVSAVIEPVSYEVSDKELQRQIDQLYTDGLASFYTEDWDKACFYFQKILSERPNHRNATEKLAESECQRKLAMLYARAIESVQAENWRAAIAALEELFQKSAEYKDAAQLLRDARKREQLTGLYAEARALYAAQKWQAVVRVFDQISTIEPNFPDAEGLLVTAEKEVNEAERLAGLQAQYSRALREMESNNWHKARSLLEIVHKSQTGFMETEKLLRKVEDEISKKEQKRKQKEQINTLYEQAHGLLRSKKWRKALDRMEEIEQTGEHFEDTDGIAQKAKTGLEYEEKETQKQNQLAAIYAEAVSLVKEERYRGALDKWQEVKAIDPKYPDRQSVQTTAERKLAERNGIIKKQNHRLYIRQRFFLFAGIPFLILLGLIGGLVYLAQPAKLPQCVYVTGLSNPLAMESKSSVSKVLIDGRVTYSHEWADSRCYRFSLMEWDGGCGGDSSAISTWYLKNDEQKLYILVNISKNVFRPKTVLVAYFFPYPYTGSWQHSDLLGLDARIPKDQYGYDEKSFYDDVADGGSMDTQAVSTLSDQYYWYEFSRPLHSGDTHDWNWNAGDKVGTEITGDLMLGSTGFIPDSTSSTYVCRLIQLSLAK